MNACLLFRQRRNICLLFLQVANLGRTPDCTVLDLLRGNVRSKKNVARLAAVLCGRAFLHFFRRHVLDARGE
jgi:hypothetical protein